MPIPVETSRPIEQQRSRFLLHTAPAEAGCTLWTGNVDGSGYGCVVVAQRRVKAHRRAYELFVGPIPPGLSVLHACDNPLCVNPAHLRTGTHTENMIDMGARRRSRCAKKTHCANGHEFTSENTYYSSQGGRQRRSCRKCRLAASRRFYGYTGQRIRIR